MIVELARAAWNRIGRATAAMLMLIAAAVTVPAQDEGQPALPDLSSTMTLQLKNQNVEQIVRFLTETTGKPAVYNEQEVNNVRVTITAPHPVTRAEALELIYDALLMQDIYLVELPNQIRIVRASQIKNMQFPSVGDEDLQAMPDSRQVMQKLYRLQYISASDVEEHLEDLVPESARTINTDTNTIILIDQVRRLKTYDAIIRTLDRPGQGEMVTEFFQLQFTDAVEMATLLTAVMSQNPELSGTANGNYQRTRYLPEGYTIGHVTLVPDSRLNTLVVTAPVEVMPRLAELIEKMDQERSPDMQMRLITVKNVDPEVLATRLNNLFSRGNRGVERDQVWVVAYTEGNSLLVRSSEDNFKLVQQIVSELDSELIEKRETRTYSIRHLDATELANQLTDLFQEQNDYYYYYSTSSSEENPRFVGIARNNTLVAMARPRDFQFIEQMINELDQPVDAEMIAPRIYQVRNTDATELVNVLTELFREGSNSSANLIWRPSGASAAARNSIQSMFGDIRFVVDNVTNRIVVLTSRPENYAIIDSMIERFDRFDPTTSEVLVYELRYADAVDIANRLNALFSDGGGQPPNTTGQQQSGGGGGGNQSQNQQPSDRRIQGNVIDQVFYPWLTGNPNQRAGEDDSRLINTMIGNVRIVPDSRSSKLLIAAPPIYFQALRNVIDQLDQPEPQVNIRTRVLEVTRGDERRIGIRWTPNPNAIEPAELENAMLGLSQLGFLDALGDRAVGPTSVNSDTNFGGIDRSFSSATGPGSTVLSADVNLALLVQLLVKNSNTRVLSEPNLTVNNNEVGHLFVGSDFPFRQGSFTLDTGAQSTEIDYREIGVTLDVKPRINADGEIVMTVWLINSSIRDERVSGDLVTNRTQLETQLAVESGQTMVIGGIFVEDDVDIRRGVPILSKVPLIGWLFRKRDSVESRRELMVFITPEVINNREDGDRLLHRVEQRVEELNGE